MVAVASGLQLQPATQKWKRTFSKMAFCVAAFFLNLLPYIAVSRAAFVYHFLPALMYSEVRRASWLLRIRRR
jgi:dolichyl-phosphate-mannose--protein O-mannosyl transferase